MLLALQYTISIMSMTSASISFLSCPERRTVRCSFFFLAIFTLIASTPRPPVTLFLAPFTLPVLFVETGINMMYQQFHGHRVCLSSPPP